MRVLALFAAFLVFLATPAGAEPIVQSASQAMARDATEYAAMFGVSQEEALARLKAQEASVAETEKLRVAYRSRLAGIFIEHQPQYRIVLLLTGSEPVRGYFVKAGGMQVPVLFRTGAAATRQQVLAAIDRYRADIREAVPGVRGLGHDPRTGELLIMQRVGAATRPPAEVEAELARLTGVPVRLRIIEAKMTNAAALGGGRVDGPASGRNYVCTTGFVVVNGRRTGVTTAAHCPDGLTYRGPDGELLALKMAGSWGAAFSDMQIHTGVGLPDGLFFADKEKTELRPVESWKTRPSSRSGDFVCLRGEITGYACSTVELVDFAPPGELCGGLCSASWVTVTGPDCHHGDSGAPVFIGTTAIGTLKGGAFLPDGTCSFYYYMSTDYLPEGWRLLRYESTR